MWPAVLPARIPYELFMCMRLALERRGLQLAWAIREGIRWALGRGPIPARYYEAISSTEEEAEERAFRENTARKEAQLGGGFKPMGA